MVSTEEYLRSLSIPQFPLNFEAEVSYEYLLESAKHKHNVNISSISFVTCVACNTVSNV